MRVAEHWNGLSGAAVESPSLEVLKNLIGQTPEQPALVDPALSSGFRLDDLQRSLPTPQQFYDPRKTHVFKFLAVGLD